MIRSGVEKIKVRRSYGPRGGWRLELDGWSDKNWYDTWQAAVNSAFSRLRKRVLANLLDEIAAHPHEYVGVPATRINGKTLGAKQGNIKFAASLRGLKIDVHREDDEQGNYDFYVACVGRRK